LSLPGRFKLASRRDTVGQRREFPCRAINLSCHAVTLATPVNGEVGERVIAQIEQFGKLEGPIMRVMEGGFVIKIIAPRQERYPSGTKSSRTTTCRTSGSTCGLCRRTPTRPW
jgi:hypothetical protein